ncbi:MAG: hypothetical protein ABIQ35_09025 [Verrucomicrobiota bacterium]
MKNKIIKNIILVGVLLGVTNVFADPVRKAPVLPPLPPGFVIKNPPINEPAGAEAPAKKSPAATPKKPEAKTPAPPAPPAPAKP